MLRSFVSEYYWASMGGEVGATCRPPAASCASGVYRLLGTDAWKSRCNLQPPVASCTSAIYQVLGIDNWPLTAINCQTHKNSLRRIFHTNIDFTRGVMEITYRFSTRNFTTCKKCCIQPDCFLGGKPDTCFTPFRFCLFGVMRCLEKSKWPSINEYLMTRSV